MNRPKSLLTRLLTVVIGILLVVSPFWGAVNAQVAGSSSGNAQVIAQGIQRLDASPLAWQVNTDSAPPASADPLEVSGTFVYVPTRQIIVESESGERQLLSEEQATYVSAESAREVHAVSRRPVEIVTISLDQHQRTENAWTSDPIEVPAGSYNLQLTRGILNPGERDSVEPANDFVYMLMVTNGSIRVGQETLADGEMASFTGDISVSPVGDAPAAYLIASIGDKVSDPATTRTAPTVQTGDIILTFYECPPDIIESGDTAGCDLITYPVMTTLTYQRDTSLVKVTANDATERTDGSWHFAKLRTGNWKFDLIIGDGSDRPRIGMTSPAQLENNDWLIPVTEGATSTVDVFLVYEEAQLGVLSVVFFECPSGTNPAEGLEACVQASTEPNLTITHLDDPDVSFRTLWEASSTESGSYLFRNLPPGTYMVSLDYNEIWNVNAVHFGGGAYSDGIDVYVDIEANGPENSILVVLSPIGDGSNVVQPTAPPDRPIAAGSVLISQQECQMTEGGGCIDAVEPWEVVLTNLETGAVFTLSADAIQVGSGRWQIVLPPGQYDVNIPYTGAWYVEYTGWIEVPEGGEALIHVTGVPD